LKKTIFLGNFPPRKCGIATFTHDLHGAVSKSTSAQCFVVAINNIDVVSLRRVYERKYATTFATVILAELLSAMKQIPLAEGIT
jgi:hypothetical protein